MRDTSHKLVIIGQIVISNLEILREHHDYSLMFWP